MLKIEVFVAIQRRVWPFKFYLFQNNLSKRKTQLKMKTSIEVLNIVCHHKTNKCTALSLQEIKLDGWFLILLIVLKTCTISFMHKCHMSFLCRFYILGFEPAPQLKG